MNFLKDKKTKSFERKIGRIYKKIIRDCKRVEKKKLLFKQERKNIKKIG